MTTKEQLDLLKRHYESEGQINHDLLFRILSHLAESVLDITVHVAEQAAFGTLLYDDVQALKSKVTYTDPHAP